jgi:two-component system chemotaxis response regulator CheB
MPILIYAGLHLVLICLQQKDNAEKSGTPAPACSTHRAVRPIEKVTHYECERSAWSQTERRRCRTLARSRPNLVETQFYNREICCTNRARSQDEGSKASVEMIRVLIVDDSAVIRRQLTDILASDPKIVVAGTAGTGHLGLHRIAELKPDLVTLDVEMPGMDGLETLVEIRKLYPRLPVIMFSALTGPGAVATVEALARGASDYVAKPTQEGSPESASERVRLELVPKIKALCAMRGPQHTPVPVATSVASIARSPQRPTRVEVVAVGTSTGGPNALGLLMPQFPKDFPVPIVIVQHMPAMFTQLLAARLDSLTQLHVQEAREGQRLLKGQVWIAPGDYHMTVVRRGTDSVLSLNQSPPENSCRPAVDVLFRTVVRAFGENVLGVVLTGMGADGTRGSAVIREAGGAVIAQDEASSVVWGMPGSVVAAGLAARICPLDGIVPEIVRRVSIFRTLASAAGG